MCCVFFFKQKTAYEMRISDWSSDVCSSDLSITPPLPLLPQAIRGAGRLAQAGRLRNRLQPASRTSPCQQVPQNRAYPRRCPSDRAACRSEERRVGKECVVRVDLGGCRCIKKKKIANNNSNISNYKYT